MSFNYIQNIPNGPNNPSTDQPNMKINTNSIFGIVAVDHIGFGPSNGGMHNQSSYVNQLSDPLSGMGIAEIYSKKVTYPGGNVDTEIFMRKATDDTNNPSSVIQLTDTRFGVNATLNGYTFLPGGIILQWGQAAFSGALTTVIVPFNVTFPAASLNVSVTLIGFNNSATVQSNMANQFQCNRSSGGGAGQQLFWIAIGN